MYLITFVLNGVRDSKAIIANNVGIAFESIDGNAKIIDFEKLY